MQEKDWGKYSQAPWMTSGAWKDTNVPASSKKTKSKKQLAQIPTTEHACDLRDMSTQNDEEKFRAEVDLADLQLQLRRWNFARSWRCASLNSLADESPASPRSRRPAEVEESAAPLSADQEEKDSAKHDDLAALSSCHPVDTIAKPNATPLDEQLIGQYLARCIAATESQLAVARNRSEKKGAVKEIERLVEKVIVAQAGLASERV